MSIAVCAVVRDPGPDALAAVQAQSFAPEHLVSHRGSWHDAVAEAPTRDADWLWLLEGDAVPEPGALEALVAPLRDPAGLPAPALLSSRVAASGGGPHPSSTPWIPLLDRAVVIAAAQHRVASLRLARWGSMLVHRNAIAEHGPPLSDFAGGADDLEWTARILREGHGYLVPRSLVTRPAAPGGTVLSADEVRDRVRMLRGERWIAQEPVWFAFMLGVDATREIRAAPRPRTAGRLARGVAAGLASIARG
ncbi:MAG: hypothetical protein AVDCRST_MAG85-1747 [uncultured Solirubrobacteraceae bacterium]|uniref:Glycosyltransferase 2-like domain-containing protein n=1 Tax=uncultured Solirubrobacteraceae bacterium TaxID=1162706 RepID=A0A6J4SJ69_9ACTN|nr:MAG: hypothetical protein AVDCRST_MAG85-1747 [uncultured Solirubrobacteraceae bacterium]